MVVLQNITYAHPNKEIIFSNLGLSVNPHDKIALAGNNGVGKSTLLQLIAGILQPSAGTVKNAVQPYYIPQLFGQFNELTVAQALHVEDRLLALQAILSGEVTPSNLDTLNDDWTIEERCKAALASWQLDDVDLSQPMKNLSGGEKTKVFLAGISIHQPELVLLDEPSNHLDLAGRKLLYDFIGSTSVTCIVVSHDRKLANLLDKVYELSKLGITVYGGNYDFYAAQKRIEKNALEENVKSKEKELRQAKSTERESIERQQKLDARGKSKQEKAGVPTIFMNTLRNSAEKSTSRIKNGHAEKTGDIAKELNELRSTLPAMDKIKLGFDQSTLHKGKILIAADQVNYGYGKSLLWNEPLHFEITSGERVALAGLNGSGKTTLIKIILGELQIKTGTLQRAVSTAVYIDQEYSLIDNTSTVYRQAQHFNTSALQEHEIKTRLSRFLFTGDDWNKSCSVLSGGEKMRLLLCCLTISHQSPDIIILDEPTNNLDIQNIQILTAAINEYKGTLIVVSHDQYFLEEIGIMRFIELHPPATKKLS